ncbi:MAG: hypothetical protein R2714_15605 [Microthrixaceae bacterium]|nr:hypothetical protein [Microthrixaceae bacterium]MCB1011699.1 hypothetical protein [Microthrixaceae bacterium]MCO5319882.1 hypothetical protein [Microthrixaceae bacterium]
MDIEHFYDGNPKRRSSREYTFGSDWTDEGGTRWEVNWVEDTGELYAMREPREPLEMDPFGDSRVPSMPADVVTVEILGNLGDLEAVESALDGWSRAQGEASSLDWVRSRIAMDHPPASEGSPDPAPDSLPGAG